MKDPDLIDWLILAFAVGMVWFLERFEWFWALSHDSAIYFR